MKPGTRIFATLVLALGFLAAPMVCPSCTTTEGGSQVDWERASMSLLVASLELHDLSKVVDDPETAEQLQVLSAAALAASETAANFEAGGPVDPYVALQALLDASEPLLSDSNDDVRFTVLALRAGLNVAIAAR